MLCYKEDAEGFSSYQEAKGMEGCMNFSESPSLLLFLWIWPQVDSVYGVEEINWKKMNNFFKTSSYRQMFDISDFQN